MTILTKLLIAIACCIPIILFSIYVYRFIRRNILDDYSGDSPTNHTKLCMKLNDVASYVNLLTYYPPVDDILNTEHTSLLQICLHEIDLCGNKILPVVIPSENELRMLYGCRYMELTSIGNIDELTLVKFGHKRTIHPDLKFGIIRSSTNIVGKPILLNLNHNRDY